MPAWHARPLEDVLHALGATHGGLTSAEAEARLASAGPNALPSAPPISRLRVLLAQLRSVIVLLLFFAGLVAWLLGETADALAIATVLVLNVALAYVLEIRAHRAIEGLARLEARRATVLRDGVPQDVDATRIVPGDVLWLEAGQVIAADARLLATTELRVVESALTGESVPVAKRSDVTPADETTLAERTNMVYSGTTAVAGVAHAVVVATGASTELGTIGRLVQATTSEPTPLERRLDALGRQLVWVALAVGGATSLLAWWQHAPLALVVQAGVALAVAAVPEGLPAVATITLALGVRRMARRRALVRRLPSVEALGAVTIICTDKTGTLTSGAMTVREVRTSRHRYEVTGEGYAPGGAFRIGGVAVEAAADADLLTALRAGVLAGRGDAVLADGQWIARGDPTEAALAVAARKAGLERHALLDDAPEIGEVPFSSERKLMATFHRPVSSGETIACVKGAPVKVLQLCASVLVDGTPHPLDEGRRRQLSDENHEMALRGWRVLATAFGAVDAPDERALQHLTFAGLVAMQDPPAEGVHAAVQRFGDAGIRTVMITGDQRGTALAIARDLQIAEADVFSRVSAEDKLRIVADYQQQGHVVAMLGDGVNDAAALKKADVGVTMGLRGTDIAREAAAVVLQDDRFETIGVAIEEGRIVFDNVRKFVFYLFSCNTAEIIVLLGAGLVGMPLPLQPIQVLWLNLVTDTLPALALAAEPGADDVMRRPPRPPDAEILSREFLRRIAGYAALVAAPVFLVMAWSYATAVPAAQAVTMNFMVLALAQVSHLGNARDERPVIRPHRALANAAAIGAVVITVVLQIAAVTVPALRTFLRLASLSAGDWLVVAAASVLPGVVGQAIKFFAPPPPATHA